MKFEWRNEIRAVHWYCRIFTFIKKNEEKNFNGIITLCNLNAMDDFFRRLSFEIIFLFFHFNKCRLKWPVYGVHRIFDSMLC